MKILRFCICFVAHAYYDRAHRQIHPLHQDVLLVNLRRLKYQARLKELLE